MTIEVSIRPHHGLWGTFYYVETSDNEKTSLDSHKITRCTNKEHAEAMAEDIRAGRIDPWSDE